MFIHSFQDVCAGDLCSINKINIDAYVVTIHAAIILAVVVYVFIIREIGWFLPLKLALTQPFVNVYPFDSPGIQINLSIIELRQTIN